jgi:transcriptional regulator with XRE-family HTH domain
MTPEELRAIRARHELSQSELAELVGVSTVAVSHWERGTRPIPLWFEKLHGYALLANSGARNGSRGPGRPPTAREAKQAESAARLEREQPIVCSIRFCEPREGRPMDPLPYRPYVFADDRYVFDDGEAVPGYPGTFPGVAKQGWCQSAWQFCREGLVAQLVAMGHLPQMAELYMVESGAKWSWHKVETSRPECIVTLAGMRRNGLDTD